VRDEMVGRAIAISPLEGESDFEEELHGCVESRLRRRAVRDTGEYYLVKLDRVLEYVHPGLRMKLEIDRVIVMPDGTRLEWAFFGGGPEGLPVLVKVFAVLPEPGRVVIDYSSGETFLLARAVARSGEGDGVPDSQA